MLKKFYLIILVALAVSFCGCDQTEKPKLIMVTNATFPPYEYIEKAMSCGCVRYSGLSKALVDLKFAVLIKLKRYSEAKKVLDASRSFLTIEDYSELQKNNLLILKQKLALQKKIEKINLKVVK